MRYMKIIISPAKSIQTNLEFPKVNFSVCSFLDESEKLVKKLQKYKVKKEAFVLILIGKDGGEKMRKEQPIQAATLFSTIDAMPMRQAEMRNHRN